MCLFNHHGVTVGLATQSIGQDIDIGNVTVDGGGYTAAGSELGLGSTGKTGRGKEGGAGEVVGGSSLSSRGHDMELHRGEAAWEPRHGASADGHYGEETEFTENPLASKILIAKRSPSNFSDLIGAFRHFLKFHKNSGGLPITPRGSTKIGVEN